MTDGITAEVSRKSRLADGCPNHNKHMCRMFAARKLKAAGQLAKDAKYLCGACGRAARQSTSLCLPVKI